MDDEWATEWTHDGVDNSHDGWWRMTSHVGGSFEDVALYNAVVSDVTISRGVRFRKTVVSWKAHVCSVKVISLLNRDREYTENCEHPDTPRGVFGGVSQI